MTQDEKKNYCLVIGLGKSGLSCLEFLNRQKMSLRILDTRDNPPNVEEFQKKFAHIPLHIGSLDRDWILNSEEIILSPGISSQQNIFQEARAKGIPIISDIELFARYVKKPICAITGSNGKSTVTTLVSEMAKAAQMRVQCGGNLGTPALDLITSPEPELYVLELSSFQLEITHSLPLQAAAFLNLSPNHLDRYANSMELYGQAKQRIYQNAQFIVWNRDDKATYPTGMINSENLVSFGLSKPSVGEFGIIKEGERIFLAFGDQELLSVDELHIQGEHNIANALAALAMGHVMGIPMSAMLSTLQTFKGLAHRCQLIGEWQQVKWFNDSKATNVTACLAALHGLGNTLKGKLVLLMGGQDKGDDFNVLKESVQHYVRAIVVYGQDGNKIQQALQDVILVDCADGFVDAITKANHYALPGDAVLLSPACASFDMFKNFEHRGEVFTQLVEEMVAN